MAAYVVTDYVTDEGTPAEVAAAIETYLETKDSTSNPIITVAIVSTFGGKCKGVVLHQGA